MSDALKFSGPIKVGNLSADPANPENGFIYYNTSTNKYKMYENGGFRVLSVEDLDAHLTDDANLKHDADEVNYQRGDGSRKNIQANATSAHAEAALTDLDDAIGALVQGTNYTAGNSAIVASHLGGIDTAIAAAGKDEFSDADFRVQDNADITKEIAFEASAITTGTLRTINMPDANVALGDIATNKGNIDGHLDAGVSKHDATEIDVEAADGKNHTQASLEVVVGELDDAIGNLTFVPSSYVNPSNDIVADHLQNIDTAMGAFAQDADVIKKDGSVAFTADQAMGGFKLTGLAAPVSGTDAARKADIDAASAGMLPKDPVELATTANVSLTAEQTIDGTLTSASRILVAYQTAAEENGIYVTAAGAWARADDADGSPSSEIQGGNSVFVNGGTLNANTVFRLRGTGEITVDVGDQDWIIYSRAEAIQDGAGLSRTGLTLNVGAGDGISVGGTTVAVDSTVVRADGSVAFTSDLPMGANKITGLAAGSVGTDAVNKTQLDAKIGNVVEDLTPQLGGNLDLNTQTLLGPAQRAAVASPSSFVQEQYIGNISLAASQTNTVIADLTFAHAVYEALEIVYKLKEATSNDVRMGTLRVVTNGTAVALNDVSTETADTGITFSAVVNGANINVRYSSGSNIVAMKADVKRVEA